jgi:hypothetical protein
VAPTPHCVVGVRFDVLHRVKALSEPFSAGMDVDFFGNAASGCHSWVYRRKICSGAPTDAPLAHPRPGIVLIRTRMCWIRTGIVLIRTRICWIRAGIVLIPMRICWIRAGIVLIRTRICSIRARIRWIRARISWIRAGIELIRTRIRWIRAGIELIRTRIRRIRAPIPHIRPRVRWTLARVAHSRARIQELASPVRAGRAPVGPTRGRLYCIRVRGARVIAGTRHVAGLNERARAPSSAPRALAHPHRRPHQVPARGDTARTTAGQRGSRAGLFLPHGRGRRAICSGNRRAYSTVTVFARFRG